MAEITSGQILLKYSVKTGSAGNSTGSSAANSLGTYISTTQWAGGVANDLFDDVSGAENASSVVDYRCIFVHNSNGSNPLTGTVVYLSAETSGGASIALAADPTAASAIGSATAQALTATTETAPGAGVTGLTYASPVTSGTGVSLGTINPGQAKAFWVRRTAANTAALSSDGVTITVYGDTGSL